MRTVVLVVRLAKLAFQAGTDLSAHTNAVSNLDCCHLVADFDSLADDFMADADWKGAITPTASDGMNVRAADSAALNFDVDITVFELLRFEFLLLKVTPFALILDHVALEGLWVRHLG